MMTRCLCLCMRNVLFWTTACSFTITGNGSFRPAQVPKEQEACLLHWRSHRLRPAQRRCILSISLLHHVNAALTFLPHAKTEDAIHTNALTFWSAIRLFFTVEIKYPNCWRVFDSCLTPCNVQCICTPCLLWSLIWGTEKHSREKIMTKT